MRKILVLALLCLISTATTASTILLYTDEEMRIIKQQQDSRMVQGIFQLVILAIIVFSVIRFIILRLINRNKQ